jgi:hypothetical protein
MNSRLEQFIDDHREEFDGEMPDGKVWEKIREQVVPEKKKQAPVVQLHRVRWTAAAAAVVLLMAGAAWYFYNGRHDGGQNTGRTIAKGITPVAHPNEAGNPSRSAPNQSGPNQASPNQTVQPNPANPGSATDIPSDLAAGTTPPEKKAGSELDATVNEEMYHYARLVELKHKELKTIEKDEPLLYRQFASDVNKLDSVYRNLQEQLPTNPNREQLLEAMLQNLQLQMGLLNHQLDIIKQINHSKKTTYDKAYKTA